MRGVRLQTDLHMSFSFVDLVNVVSNGGIMCVFGGRGGLPPSLDLQTAEYRDSIY